jgi:nucleoside-diphosphate-sugar epimerase
VRLLVRRADRIAPALDPLIDSPSDSVDHVVGDVTDAASVTKALAGCDAVVHAAAIFSLDSRMYKETSRTNVAGAAMVLKAAAEQGCDPIVHVSSTAAILRPHATVHAESPLCDSAAPYIKSKAESERVARELRAQGAPVVIVQPGAVFGPHDPHLSDNMRRLRDVLRGLYPMWPTGGLHAVDVRDVAAVNAAVVARRKPGAYIVPGSFMDGRAFFTALRKVTGRRLPHLTVPATAILPFAWVASRLQPMLPFHVPADHEALVFTRYATRCDDSAAREELGVQPRSLEQTLGDAVRWLKEARLVRA